MLPEAIFGLAKSSEQPASSFSKIFAVRAPEPPTLSDRFRTATSSRHALSQPLANDRSVSPESTSDKESLRFVTPSVIEPSWFELSNVLADYPSTKRKVDTMVSELRRFHPQVPGPFINYPDGPFPRDKPYQVFRSHFIPESENFELAVENIGLSGRVLNTEDEKYLRYILRSPLGWSSTWKSHHNDAWVKHIQHRFTHIMNLRPILDDLTWPEEIHLFPPGYGPGGPQFMLLANETFFYLYYLELDELLRAGESLREVYIGLQNQRWDINLADEERFFREPDNGEEYNLEDYFPEWRSDGTGGHELNFPLCEFVPHSG